MNIKKFFGLSLAILIIIFIVISIIVTVRLVFFVNSPDGSKTGLVDTIAFGEIKEPRLIVTKDLTSDTIINKINNLHPPLIIFKDPTTDQFTILAEGICPIDDHSYKSNKSTREDDECEIYSTEISSSMEILLQMASLSKNAHARGCPNGYHKECTTVVSGGDVYKEKCYCEAN